MIIASELFSRAKFYSLKKSEELRPSLNKKILQIEKPSSFVNFHEDRAREFLLGRLCVSEAHRMITGEDLLNISVNSNRAPVWPLGYVGSISHDKIWVGAAVAKSSELLGIGIDFEIKGRARLNLRKQITNDHDLSTHTSFSDEELLTLIFSIKECLYKALNPIVNKFFGFEDAAVIAIDTQNRSFEIKLLSKLSDEYCPGKHDLFTGGFIELPDSFLTVLELT
jgi:enterobactin synthetase component D